MSNSITCTSTLQINVYRYVNQYDNFHLANDVVPLNIDLLFLVISGFLSLFFIIVFIIQDLFFTFL